MLHPTTTLTDCHISPRFCGTGSHLSTLRRSKGKHQYPCISCRIYPSCGIILHLLREAFLRGCSTEQYEGEKVTYSGRRVNQYWSDAEPVVVRAATTTGRMSDHYWLHSPQKAAPPKEDLRGRCLYICIGLIRWGGYRRGWLP